MAKSGTNAGNSERASRVASQNEDLLHLARSRIQEIRARSTCSATLLHCKLKSVVIRIATFAPNLPRNKFRCRKLRQHVAQSRP